MANPLDDLAAGYNKARKALDDGAAALEAARKAVPGLKLMIGVMVAVQALTLAAIVWLVSYVLQHLK